MPAKHFINWQQDPHGNYLARVVFPETTRQFLVEVELVAECRCSIRSTSSSNHRPRRSRSPTTRVSPRSSRRISNSCLRVRGFASFSTPSTSVRSARSTSWSRLNRPARAGGQVHHPARARRADARGHALARFSGSCRDSSWLLVQILRHLGLAARFVSGYLIQLTPTSKSLDGPSGAAADFTDLHAWAEVYLPGAGWIGLDPTSGLLAGEGHIPLAATPDPQSAAPVTGAVDECRGDLSSRDERAAHLRIAARDQAVHRRTVAADRCARPADRRGALRPATCG